MNRRQQKRKHARRVQHAQATRTPDQPELTISGAGCPKVDNGHIVPRMYQRAWEGERCLVAVHEPGSPAFELKSTKLAGVRGPYYRRTRPRHGTQTDDIEASLGYVENKAAPALRQVIAGKPLTIERKGALAQLFGVQMMRGPASFEQHEELHRASVRFEAPAGLVSGRMTSHPFLLVHLEEVAGSAWHRVAGQRVNERLAVAVKLRALALDGLVVKPMFHGIALRHVDVERLGLVASPGAPEILIPEKVDHPPGHHLYKVGKGLFVGFKVPRSHAPGSAQASDRKGEGADQDHGERDERDRVLS